ncbi:hypothetical protein LENED_003919 [Lentinula edodes]|uniref:Uncharacterized protein n=2 Tax=Lentinula TaxID=5352 RepID=A0A1Q3E597_LENED|nr:hypothetical protein LENED_003919 [Lentinula edodes]
MLPATYPSTSPAATFIAPPPSPHPDRNSDSGQSALLCTPPHLPPSLPLTPKPPPVFEIMDEDEGVAIDCGSEENEDRGGGF